VVEHNFQSAHFVIYTEHLHENVTRKLDAVMGHIHSCDVIKVSEPVVRWLTRLATSKATLTASAS